MEKFLAAQINAIDKHIYIESQKAHRNLRFNLQGQLDQSIFIQWIDLHANKFRNGWSLSICKNCKNATTCYECLKQECDCFELEN